MHFPIFFVLSLVLLLVLLLFLPQSVMKYSREFLTTNWKMPLRYLHFCCAVFAPWNRVNVVPDKF